MVLNIQDDFEILAPRLLIVHVLFNLIKNGLQHVQKSNGAWLEISTELGRTHNKIIVQDNGVGIPAYALPHVFDRFYTTNTTGQGAGIGLSFCRMVMESIGGKITCESVEGKHTTFTLYFNRV